MAKHGGNTKKPECGSLVHYLTLSNLALAENKAELILCEFSDALKCLNSFLVNMTMNEEETHKQGCLVSSKGKSRT